VKRIGEVVTGCRGRQRLSVLPVEIDGLVNDLTQLGEHLPLVIAVTAAKDQTRGSADIALILLGPLDDLYVSGAVFHSEASSIARRTALTW
jgi:hypothetical protein